MAGYNVYNNKLFNPKEKINRPPSIFQKQPAAKLTKDITKPTSTSTSGVHTKESTSFPGKSNIHIEKKSESMADSSVEKQSTTPPATKNKPGYGPQFKKTPLLVKSVAKTADNIDTTSGKEDATISKVATLAPIVPTQNTNVQSQFRKAQFNYKPQPQKSAAVNKHSDAMPQFEVASDVVQNEPYLSNETITSPAMPSTKQNPFHVDDANHLKQQVVYKSKTLDYLEHLEELQKAQPDLGSSHSKSKRAAEEEQEDEISDIDVSQIVQEINEEQAAKKRRLAVPLITEKPPPTLPSVSVAEVVMMDVPIAMPQPPSLPAVIAQPPVAIASNEDVAPNPFKYIRVVETLGNKHYVVYVSDPRVKIQIEMELAPSAHDNK